MQVNKQATKVFRFKHSANHNAYYVKTFNYYTKHLPQTQYIQAACDKWGFTQAQIKSIVQHLDTLTCKGYKIVLHSN